MSKKCCHDMAGIEIIVGRIEERAKIAYMNNKKFADIRTCLMQAYYCLGCLVDPESDDCEKYEEGCDEEFTETEDRKDECGDEVTTQDDEIEDDCSWELCEKPPYCRPVCDFEF